MNAAELERTPLWKRTLAPRRRDPNADARELLRSAFLLFRERAAIIANDIARDLPEYTVHDVTHLDAVWQTADLIGGPQYPLNPAEAFVLGGAILLHDLGMGLAAYPGGLTVLRQETVWKD